MEVIDALTVPPYSGGTGGVATSMGVLLLGGGGWVQCSMRLICSLLEMQAGASSGEEAKAKLREAAMRVRSIALAQEALHDNESFSSVDLGNYLRSMVTAVGGMQERIRFEMAVEKIPFALDRAVPTGLIVNELLTNALKHALGGHSAGGSTAGGRRNGDDHGGRRRRWTAFGGGSGASTQPRLPADPTPDRSGRSLHDRGSQPWHSYHYYPAS